MEEDNILIVKDNEDEKANLKRKEGMERRKDKEPSQEDLLIS